MTGTASPPEMLQDRYTLLEETGSLAFARFFRCVDRRGEESVASVVELTGLDPATAAAVVRSARAWAGSAVEGAQGVTAIEESGGSLLVVEEAVGGVPVSASSPERGAYLGAELARIVAHLHEAGLPVTVLPAEAVREVPRRGVVILHPWLLSVLAELLRGRRGEFPDLNENLPPECRRGGPVTARTGVYAVALLVGELLRRGGRGNGTPSPAPPELLQVLEQATDSNPARRPSGMRELSRLLQRAVLRGREVFRPTRRIRLPGPPPVRFAPRRALLPRRPAPEQRAARVRPWMVAAVVAAGILAFLYLLPRIQNPMEPLQATMEEIRQVFAPRPSGSPAAPETAGDSVIPGAPFKTPDFRGHQQAETQIQAGRIGLELQVEEEFSADVKPGVVMRQVPDPGAVINEPYRVTIVVSRGEASAFLASVVGKTAVEARETLTSLGFLVVEIPTFDEKKPAGEVLAQDPAAGAVRKKGEQVVLKVSQGAQRAPVPSLEGLAEADAARLAGQQGFRVQIEYVAEAPAAFNPGEVAAQTPAARTMAEPEGVISLTVFRPEPSTVPLVTGLELDAASLALDSAGLVVNRVTEREVPDQTSALVIDQSPPPGTRVERGSMVDLVLARPGPTPTPSPSPSPTP